MIDGFKITKEIEPEFDPSSNFKNIREQKTIVELPPEIATIKFRLWKIALEKKK